MTRIGLGIAALAALLEVGPRLLRLSDPEILQVPYFAGLEELASHPSVALGIGLTWAGTAAAFLVGWRTRVAGAGLALAIAAALVLDRQLYSNHIYLLALLVFLVTVADGGARLSLDSRRRGARSAPRWGVELVKLQVSLVYAFAAFSKMNLAFLSGAILGAELGRGLVPIPDALRGFELLFPLAVSTVAVELSLAGALWSRRWKEVAMTVGVAFHVGTVLLLEPTYEFLVFALTILPAYALFASPPSGAAGSLRPRAAAELGGAAR